MFGITYDAHADMDGKFQVIGEIEEGWDSLIEIECACVQPVAYYYPNNQHLMALAEQTGADKDPLLLERIALGLQVKKIALFTSKYMKFDKYGGSKFSFSRTRTFPV